jgi:hypothetical protein
METVTFLGKQKSAKNFIDPHDCCIPKELTILSIGGDSSTPLYAVLSTKISPDDLLIWSSLRSSKEKSILCFHGENSTTLYCLPKQNDG